MPLTGERARAVAERLAALGVRDEDLEETFVHSGGKGGQNVNKVETAVRITHLPTNTVVACQVERSQGKNRDLAMKMLRSKLYDMELQKRQQETDKLDETKLEISFGSQIRSYVLQPYQLVKDLRTDHEVGNPRAVLDGDLDGFIDSYLRMKLARGRFCGCAVTSPLRTSTRWIVDTAGHATPARRSSSAIEAAPRGSGQSVRNRMISNSSAGSTAAGQ